MFERFSNELFRSSAFTSIAGDSNHEHLVLIVSSNGLMDNGIVEYNIVSSLDREFYSCSCKCMSMSACHADSHVPDRMEPKEEQKGLFPLQLTLLGVHTNGSARYGTKFSVLHS